ncbi:MAG: NTP transferase domain-containing protein [Rhizobium sp.]|uniref:NTP transferase domain-containing protein n=1 Tax=Rhizobium sp. TaxID=391 RepID=UPI00389A2A40
MTLAADLEAWIATDEKRRVRDFLLRHDVTEVAFPLHPTRASLPSITHVVTVSVDCPFFPADLVARLTAAVEHPSQIAIAVSEGRSHPVFGLWPVTLAADLEAWIASDEKRRVRDFLLRHDVTEVAFPLHPTRASLLDPFFNINTPDDLVEAERWLEALRG